jgi:hypothetical protein
MCDVFIAGRALHLGEHGVKPFDAELQLGEPQRLAQRPRADCRAAVAVVGPLRRLAVVAVVAKVIVAAARAALAPLTPRRRAATQRVA